jgi:cyclophilin family peptidyl-prolyl cis-trans isomerase
MKLIISVASIAIGILTLTASPRAQKPAPPAAKSGPPPVIVLDTVKGPIEIETFPDEAPKTVEHIVELVKKNFYNGLRFHRVEEDFLVQIGDPTSRDMSREAYWGRGPGSGKPIGVSEISKKRRHAPGIVAMAHSGDPKFADSQFYIVMQPRPGLDGRFTIFGRVTSGMDVVKKLKRADILKRASVKS